MQSTNFTTMTGLNQPVPGPRFDRNRILTFVASMKFLVIVIIILQIIVIYFLINPINLISQLSSVQVLNKVAALTVVPTEIPNVGVVGDNKTLPDIETIKKANSVQAQVFKDAKNGDYVLNYTTKFVIYRESENKLIYDGDSPTSIINKAQETILTNVTAKAKELGVIDNNSTEQPQLQAVTDAATLKSSNSTFYSDVQNDDVVALFAQAKKIVLYRPSTNTIIKYGQYEFVIN